jgi:hypothetical protein
MMLGIVKVNVNAITTSCIAEHLRYTRSYEVRTFFKHRCSGMGSCKGRFCGTISLDARLDEMIDSDSNVDYNVKPGFTKCEDACSDPSCSCGPQPGSGCLFWKNYADPASQTLFETFSCPVWEYRIKMQVRVETQTNVTTAELTMIPGASTTWDDISFLTKSSGVAPAPILGRKFVTDGNRVAIADEIRNEFECLNEQEAMNFTCHLPPDVCQCTTAEERANCHCRNARFEDLLENPYHALPLTRGDFEIRNEGREVFAYSAHHPIDLTIGMTSFRLVAQVDQNLCDMQMVDLNGCFRCQEQATLRTTCMTSYGVALAKIHCREEDIFFTQICSMTKKTESHSLPFQRAQVEDVCEIQCPGGTTEMRIEGKLQYFERPVSDYQLSLSRTGGSGGDFWTNLKNFADWRAVLWFLLTPTHLLFIGLTMLLTLAVIVVIVKLQPARLLRKALRFVILMSH